MNKENWMATSDVVGVLTLALMIVTLLLWLNGNFAWEGAGMSKSDVQSAVTSALNDFDFTANAPAAPTAAPKPAPKPAAPTKVSISDLKKGLEGTYVEGNADAKISIIEFADLECPFCQRHANNGTLEKVLEKYGDDVNTIFMHFPLWFHQTAQKAWEALECAWEVEGAEGFLKLKKALFAKGGKPTLDVIRATAEENGFNADELMACVDSGKYAQTLKDQMTFGRKLWVTGTPGNIVVNNKTGDFIKVSWAVPAEAFDAAVTQYLK